MPVTTAELCVRTQHRGSLLGDLFGIFLEDLNHAADGGLYGELVQNRSFEYDPMDRPDYHRLTAWEKVERDGGSAEVTVESSQPISARNRNYAVVAIIAQGDGVGIMNCGYNTGIPVRKGERYLFSLYARRDDSFDQPLTIALESRDGLVHARAAILVDSAHWKKYDAVLLTAHTDFSSRLVLCTKGRGRIYLDMVSLFPQSTFRSRTNGMRPDIAQLLADLKPRFLRFPGGCLVHDGSLNPDDRDSMYRWKNTLGDIADRPSRRNNWRYNQTLGLGFYEYILFCEDIGARPIPVLPGGYDPHHQRIVPLEELGPWIDDALDLIEFATGDVTSSWGAVRAELGHPAPFDLHYIGIGNEEVGAPFFDRYEVFHRAIKARYPDIKIINTSGPFAAGGEFERGWKSARDNGSDYVDEHYYQAPEWFLANYHRYDRYDASGPKVFLGEYASWGNTYRNALVEAAFMTGLEKNAGVVGLACYAPMLCNVDYVNWRPDLIFLNNHEAFGTANYYVQKLFMNHQGDQLLRVELKHCGEPQEIRQHAITGDIALVADRSSARFSEIRLTNKTTGEIRSFDDPADVIVDPTIDDENVTSRHVLDIGITDWDCYVLSFRAVRTGGRGGFAVHFGKIDESNLLYWEIGGWQNTDSGVCSRIAGRTSYLTRSWFTVEPDVEYEMALEVTGRHIRTFIDDVVVNDTVDELPVTEPLYHSASVVHASEQIIVKVVNVRDTRVSAQVILEDLRKESAAVQVFEMSGHSLEDENCFDAPMRVCPKQRTFRVEGNAFSYMFPEYSITVFRVE
jgi:alpha-L-arabinofuranosidase